MAGSFFNEVKPDDTFIKIGSLLNQKRAVSNEEDNSLMKQMAEGGLRGRMAQAQYEAKNGSLPKFGEGKSLLDYAQAPTPAQSMPQAPTASIPGGIVAPQKGQVGYNEGQVFANEGEKNFNSALQGAGYMFDKTLNNGEGGYRDKKTWAQVSDADVSNAMSGGGQQKADAARGIGSDAQVFNADQAAQVSRNNATVAQTGQGTMMPIPTQPTAPQFAPKAPTGDVFSPTSLQKEQGARQDVTDAAKVSQDQYKQKLASLNPQQIYEAARNVSPNADEAFGAAMDFIDTHYGGDPAMKQSVAGHFPNTNTTQILGADKSGLMGYGGKKTGGGSGAVENLSAQAGVGKNIPLVVPKGSNAAKYASENPMDFIKQLENGIPNSSEAAHAARDWIGSGKKLIDMPGYSEIIQAMQTQTSNPGSNVSLIPDTMITKFKAYNDSVKNYSKVPVKENGKTVMYYKMPDGSQKPVSQVFADSMGAASNVSGWGK
jgi:hypothetical protein